MLSRNAINVSMTGTGTVEVATSLDRVVAIAIHVGDNHVEAAWRRQTGGKVLADHRLSRLLSRVRLLT